MHDFSCPLPSADFNHSRIQAGHGSGGKMTADLIRNIFQKYLISDGLAQGNDAAVLPIPDSTGRIAVTTDSHIVAPLFFPGGDIGRLAVCGTVNDLLTSGAVPVALTAGFILEEGFRISELERILKSMQMSAVEANVQIVAGDTKVVEKGRGDGLFITTAGFGWIRDDFQPQGDLAKPGDAVLVTGTVGDHGMALRSRRAGFPIRYSIRYGAAQCDRREITADCTKYACLARPDPRRVRDYT